MQRKYAELEAVTANAANLVPLFLVRFFSLDVSSVRMLITTMVRASESKGQKGDMIQASIPRRPSAHEESLEICSCFCVVQVLLPYGQSYSSPSTVPSLTWIQSQSIYLTCLSFFTGILQSLEFHEMSVWYMFT